MMLSNRIAAAVFGAVTLAASAFAIAPATAAPVSAGATQAAPAGDLVQEAQYYGPRRHYGPRRYYGRPVYRPRCFFVDRRVWNGYRWVIRPVRVCR
jgi:hypothetical protein